MKKAKNTKIKNLTLTGLATTFLLFTGGCTTLLKTAINLSKEGRDTVSFVRESYTNPEKMKSATIEIPEDFYEKVEKGQVKDVLLYIHGYTADSSKWGEDTNPDSPLSIANRIFDNNVLCVDYSSSYKIPEISKQIFSELEKIYSTCGGKLPKLCVVGHSMGGIIALYMSEKRPEYFKNINPIASPLSGINFGHLNPYLIKAYPEILGLKRELSQNIEDLFKDSCFLEELSSNKKIFTSEGELENKVRCNIYAFDSKNNNLLINGPDDGLVSIDSAYPYKKFVQNQFSGLELGHIIIFEGDVNHYSSTHNPNIMETILLNAKNSDYLTKKIPTPKEALRVKIPKAPESELNYRKSKKH